VAGCARLPLLSAAPGWPGGGGFGCRRPASLPAGRRGAAAQQSGGRAVAVPLLQRGVCACPELSGAGCAQRFDGIEPRSLPEPRQPSPSPPRRSGRSPCSSQAGGWHRQPTLRPHFTPALDPARPPFLPARAAHRAPPSSDPHLCRPPSLQGAPILHQPFESAPSSQALAPPHHQQPRPSPAQRLGRRAACRPRGCKPGQPHCGARRAPHTRHARAAALAPAWGRSSQHAARARAHLALP
jgi:hypothetical protein